jgi:hypothetical protein
LNTISITNIDAIRKREYLGFKSNLHEKSQNQSYYGFFGGLFNCQPVWLAGADGWCWFLLREEYCWLVASGWFVLREKYCWLVADKPSEQGDCKQNVPSINND